MSKQKFVTKDGSELSTKNYDSEMDLWSGTVRDGLDGLQPFALFAFDHYVEHGQTAYINKFYHSARLTRGAIINTLMAWTKACVNVTSKGKGQEVVFSSDKKVDGNVYLIEPEEIGMWHQFEDKTAGEVVAKAFTFEMMIDKLSKIANGDLGDKFTVDEVTRAIANTMISVGYANRAKSGSVVALPETPAAPKAEKPAAAPAVEAAEVSEADLSEFDAFTATGS